MQLLINTMGGCDVMLCRDVCVCVCLVTDRRFVPDSHLSAKGKKQKKGGERRGL